MIRNTSQISTKWSVKESEDYLNQNIGVSKNSRLFDRDLVIVVFFIIFVNMYCTHLQKKANIEINNNVG